MFLIGVAGKVKVIFR